jgi:hypothetical protein
LNDQQVIKKESGSIIKLELRRTKKYSIAQVDRPDRNMINAHAEAWISFA